MEATKVVLKKMGENLPSLSSPVKGPDQSAKTLDDLTLYCSCRVPFCLIQFIGKLLCCGNIFNHQVMYLLNTP